MCIYRHIYICTYVCVCICAYMCVYTPIQQKERQTLTESTGIYKHVYIYIRVCMYIHICVCLYTPISFVERHVSWVLLADTKRFSADYIYFLGSFANIQGSFADI